MKLRTHTQKIYAIPIVSAFVFGFLPVSCFVHFPEGLDLVPQPSNHDQCVEHTLNTKTPHDENIVRLNVPLPKPLKFLLSGSVVQEFKLTYIRASPKLSPDQRQRMRVPIQRMSMPFKIEGFSPYFMATRDG
jgi:hypothetical protein